MAAGWEDSVLIGVCRSNMSEEASNPARADPQPKQIYQEEFKLALAAPDSFVQDDMSAGSHKRQECKDERPQQGYAHLCSPNV